VNIAAALVHQVGQRPVALFRCQALGTGARGRGRAGDDWMIRRGWALCADPHGAYFASKG
jgi:hypothetical protein